MNVARRSFDDEPPSAALINDEWQVLHFTRVAETARWCVHYGMPWIVLGREYGTRLCAFGEKCLQPCLTLWLRLSWVTNHHLVAPWGDISQLLVNGMWQFQLHLRCKIWIPLWRAAHVNEHKVTEKKMLIIILLYYMTNLCKYWGPNWTGIWKHLKHLRKYCSHMLQYRVLKDN